LVCHHDSELEDEVIEFPDQLDPHLGVDHHCQIFESNVLQQRNDCLDKRVHESVGP
jgi:hypothetical protein